MDFGCVGKRALATADVLGHGAHIGAIVERRESGSCAQYGGRPALSRSSPRTRTGV
jgi:hypothetical protein